VQVQSGIDRANALFSIRHGTEDLYATNAPPASR
jgi:hypothetical protein